MKLDEVIARLQAIKKTTPDVQVISCVIQHDKHPEKHIDIVTMETETTPQN
jgi:hypothetical protein